jgi:DNA-binding IclR family transcriptional regulator
LHEELQREVRRGIHIDEEQTAVGMISFSAPIGIGRAGPPFAAIALSTRAVPVRTNRRKALIMAVRSVVDECIRRSANAGPYPAQVG